MQIVDTISYFLFIGAITYYFTTTLQWFNYRLNRAIFHHTKPLWNFFYFFLPVGAFEAFVYAKIPFASAAVTLIYIIALFLWYKKLDKPLVFTNRVKRFLAILTLVVLFSFFVFQKPLVFIPLMLAWGISLLIETMLFALYKKEAQKKLEKKKDLIIIGVTASYGKTSTKNFIAQILSQKYKVYATPRSVNTIAGVVKDINEDLPEDTQVYVVEMGARQKGDIAQIAHLVNEHYAVVGVIGPAHIEYFKSLNNIRDTKLEILQSKRLKKAWIHKSANIKNNNPKVVVFGDEIKDIHSTLDGVEFSLNNKRYKANILGSFNTINLTAAILVARELGLSEDEIEKALLQIKPIAHRLQKIEANGKIIIDDSFNGNLEGMLEAFKIASSYNGRKVLITPGLIEVEEEQNEKIAQKANEIFDLVVVTGELNFDIFKKYVDENKLIHLKEKSNFESFLAQNTKKGDLILFANDAPSFI